MSAYVVDIETLDRVLTAILDYQDDIGRFVMQGLDAYTLGDAESMKTLGQDLWNMNRDAVNQRYDELEEAPEYDRYTPATVTPVQGLKSLQCFLYQCTEGDVPTQPLFQTMDAIERALARMIIDRLPEYQAAEWG